MTADEQELTYYRAVEDFFAGLRGVPHTLTPKDMHLLRTWWQSGVPLRAVTSGVAEVFAHRWQRGETSPVVSLYYCRHAVQEHATRLAMMNVGAEPHACAQDSAATVAAVEHLALGLENASRRLATEHAAVAEALTDFARRLRTAATLEAAALEEHLFALETALLQACFEALSTGARARLEEHAERLAAASGATGAARQRAWLASRDRELRELLGLPRLEMT